MMAGSCDMAIFAAVAWRGGVVLPYCFFVLSAATGPADRFAAFCESVSKVCETQVILR